MRIVFFLVLLVGLAIAGFAGNMVLQQFEAYRVQIANLEVQVGERIELKEVAVAAEDLKYGAQLTQENVQLVKFPADALPENSFVELEELFGAEGADKEPRTILRGIDKGEVISSLKVTGFGQDAGVASRLERGMRAFTLKVDVASGVSGFLRPDDSIDIYWTGRVSNEMVSRLILDGVKLIAIDQSSQKDLSRPTVARTVTVAVSPQIVAALAQAQATGKLQLSLRGIGDDTTSGNIEVDQNSLLGREDKEEEVVEKKKVCTIKSRKGSEIVEIPIPCPKEQ